MHSKKKIFIILLILLLILNTFFFHNVTYARYAGVTGGEEEEQAKEKATSKTINPDDYKPKDSGDETEFTSKANVIIGIVQAMGSIVSVLALVILGIKFALGSAEEKADYKQWMIYYVIGAILVFAISNVSAAIYHAVQG